MIDYNKIKKLNGEIAINKEKLKTENDIKMKEKIYRHLLSRGFSYDSINYAYKEIFS